MQTINDKSNRSCSRSMTLPDERVMTLLKKTFFLASALTFLVTLLVLNGCGAAGSSPSTQVVSGIAAVGTPLSGQVSLKDSSNPSLAKDTVIGPDGSFAFDVTSMKAPFLLQADGHANGRTYRLHSFAAGTGTVNINPLSDVLVTSAGDGDDTDELFSHPDAQRMEKIRNRIDSSTADLLEQLRPLLKHFNAGGKDPIKDRFVADHHGLDGVLDHVNISIVDSILTITNKETGAVIFTGSITDLRGGHFTANDDDLPRPMTVPEAPDDIVALGGSGQVTLSWESVSNATTYNLYYASSPGVTTSNGTKIPDVTSPFVQTNLTANSTYYYIVTAINSAGESDVSSQVSAATDATQPPATLPTSPMNVFASGGTNQVTLSWKSVSNATSYNIYYSASEAGVTTANGLLIANATSPAVLGDLTPGITYYLIVTAVNSAGEGSASVQVAATTLTDIPTPTIPTFPKGVSALGGAEQATITWNTAPDATSYNLYWSTSATLTTSNGTQVSGISSPYVKTGLSAGTTYYFIVTAVNSAGESVASSLISANTDAPLPTVPTPPTNVTPLGGNKQVTISWSDVAGATSYNIYWATTPGVTTASTRITTAGSPYVQTGLNAATTYYYIVAAVNSSGQSVASAQMAATTNAAVAIIPAAPASLSAVGGAKALTLTWPSVAGATSYNIYWSTTSGTSLAGTRTANVASPYVLTGLAESTIYYATVTAVNSAGEGAASTETSATTNAAAPLACGTCHAIPPSTGTHTLHVVSQNIGCATCHGSGYSSTTVNATTHMNGVNNVTLSVWNATTNSCATYCHGSKSW